jgi:hypothetical protein
MNIFSTTFLRFKASKKARFQPVSGRFLAKNTGFCIKKSPTGTRLGFSVA